MREFIIAGLGNPDRKYSNTRHNIGFMVLDKLCEKFAFSDFDLWKGEAMISEGEIENIKIKLIKPYTYMNNSGIALKKIMGFYHWDKSNLLVVLDDVSLEFGKIRIRKKGSAGGHNGLKSILENFGSEDIMRFRIGIGSNKNSDLSKFVLSNFSTEEQRELVKVIDFSCEAIFSIIREGIDSAMNKYNV
jgi:PTH1 family peptidyl-tRNA hydrolase